MIQPKAKEEMLALSDTELSITPQHTQKSVQELCTSRVSVMK